MLCTEDSFAVGHTGVTSQLYHLLDVWAKPRNYRKSLLVGFGQESCKDNAISLWGGGKSRQISWDFCARGRSWAAHLSKRKYKNVLPPNLTVVTVRVSMQCQFSVIIALFGRKKEWNSDTCHDVDEPWKHDAQVQNVTCGRIPLPWNVQNRQKGDCRFQAMKEGGIGTDCKWVKGFSLGW